MKNVKGRVTKLETRQLVRDTPDIAIVCQWLQAM